MNDTPIATEKGRRTEQAFVQAARKVFAEKGYLAAKISDIAAAAGRSPGSFYNYHESKRQLLEHLLDEFQDRILTDTRDQLTADPARNIDTAVRVYWGLYRDYLPEMIGAFQLSMTDPAFGRWWRTRRAQGIDAVLGVFRSVEHRGTDIGLDKHLFASAIVSMLDSFCWNWFVTGRDETLRERSEEEAIATLVEIWRRGLVVPADRPSPHDS
ncbi:TetR/AcrR family transcriptional regulator [Williamsia serinedens]|uniref:Transcriptional regulator, TetR family n=1 Tax=Williamsia serinedens TaxID=391736 RepID=A0ABT1H0M2_9NOCA|nr:TetR/AcrR family transcriptional regulator [Williamsia serinedens]MCP2160681.1 transcriptional regulator, TetR family [Williamsia serinedens]